MAKPIMPLILQEGWRLTRNQKPTHISGNAYMDNWLGMTFTIKKVDGEWITFDGYLWTHIDLMTTEWWDMD